jgi:hypothetical protein
VSTMGVMVVDDELSTGNALADGRFEHSSTRALGIVSAAGKVVVGEPVGSGATRRCGTPGFDSVDFGLELSP